MAKAKADVLKALSDDDLLAQIQALTEVCKSHGINSQWTDCDKALERQAELRTEYNSDERVQKRKEAEVPA